MASIASEKNGHRRIQFVAPDGRRPTVRLGKVSRRFAEGVKYRVEQILSAQLTGQPVDADTSRWVASLDERLHGRLAAVGLCQSRDKRGAETLGHFLDAYIDRRSDSVKSATLTVWGHTRRNLVEFFGPSRLLDSITEGDAEEWRESLLKAGLAPSTVRKRCGFAKQFFAFAVRKKLIPANPFASLKSAATGNPDRFYFVTRDEAQAVLDACPDAEWRLLFALSRYGGLRCPSEHLTLRWGDVDWEKGRITVTSPKTAHHEGKGTRVIPLYPELRPYLEAVWEGAPEGTVHVITRYRNTNANLRTQLLRIIRRAGLEPWPKLFQNLRSTRQTELEETFPSHVVCKWMGNSQSVARKHYLQVTDEHFQKAAQNPAQSVHALSCNTSQAFRPPNKKNLFCRGLRAGAILYKWAEWRIGDSNP